MYFKNTMEKDNIVVLTFRRRLAELRKERGLSQKQTGRELGMPQQTYHSYEAGPSVVTLPIAQKMASFFGVSTDYLAGLSDERNPQNVELLCEKLGTAAKEILLLLDRLNDTGKFEALKRLSELTLIPVYTESSKSNSHSRKKSGGEKRISA